MPVKENFYNTINLSGSALKKAVKAAKSQDDKILLFFGKEKNRDKNFSPAEIWKKLFDTNKTPLTSIRRSITNLQQAGFLEKTSIQKDGPYGKKNYCWKFFNKIN